MFAIASSWQCRIHTGNQRGAGTDAQVFIQVYGQDGKHSEVVPLNSKGDSFESVKIETSVHITIPVSLGRRRRVHNRLAR